MFATLRLRNVGPHVDLTLSLDPAGHTTVSGPSGAGKSTIPDAIVSLLFGDTLNANDSAPDGAAIVGVTAKCSTLTRDGNRYSFTRKGERAQHFPAHAPYAKQVGNYAKQAEVGRFVVVPHAADDFYTRDRGRCLRNVITAALGDDDISGIVAGIMDTDARSADPADLGGHGGALALQTQANRDVAVADGALQAATAVVVRATAELERAVVPSEVDQAEARQTLYATDEWKRRDDAMIRYNAATETREAAERHAADYDARLIKLGARPEYDSAELMAAMVVLHTAENAANEIRRVERDVEVARLTAEAVAKAERDAGERAKRVVPVKGKDNRNTPLTNTDEPEPIEGTEHYDPNWQNPTPANLALIRVQCGLYGAHVVGFDTATQQAEAFDSRRIGPVRK